MANRVKLLRYEAAIKETINHALTYEVNNKLASFASVTKVELTNDLSFATVYLDCLHRENIDKIISNVKTVEGFLRSKVAHNLNTFRTPQLKFVSDKTIDYANNIENLLKQIKDKENNK